MFCICLDGNDAEAAARIVISLLTGYPDEVAREVLSALSKQLNKIAAHSSVERCSGAKLLCRLEVMFAILNHGSLQKQVKNEVAELLLSALSLPNEARITPIISSACEDSNLSG